MQDIKGGNTTHSKLFVNNTSVNPPNTSTNYTIADVGGNYLAMEALLAHQKPINNGPIVILTNYNTMQATLSGMLNLPYPPYKARVA